MDSILTSIKKLLGVVEDYIHFDGDITIHINSVLNVLTQLGVGPKEGFVITDKSSVWSDFDSDNAKISFIKSYVYLKVKMIFDPPTSSAVIGAIKETIAELEWRILAETETTIIEEV